MVNPQGGAPPGDFKFEMPEMPKREPVAVPKLPDFTPWTLFQTLRDSPQFHLLLICFACLLLTIIVSVLVLFRLRASDAGKEDAKRKVAVIAEYLGAIDGIRVEQDQLMKRLLREGRWPDPVKAQWEEEERTRRREFHMEREPLLKIAGAAVEHAVKTDGSVFKQVLGAQLEKVHALSSRVEEIDDDDNDHKTSSASAARKKAQ
jgi:hypothetical protein